MDECPSISETIFGFTLRVSSSDGLARELHAALGAGGLRGREDRTVLLYGERGRPCSDQKTIVVTVVVTLGTRLCGTVGL